MKIFIDIDMIYFLKIIFKKPVFLLPEHQMFIVS